MPRPQKMRPKRSASVNIALQRMFPLLDKNPENAFLGCFVLGKKSRPSSSEVDIVVSYPISYDLLVSQVVADSG